MAIAYRHNGSGGFRGSNTGLHVLVVNLGLGQPKMYGPLGYASTHYLMPDGKTYFTPLAGFGLWKWLEETSRPPAAVVFACTKDAWREREQLLKDHAKQVGLDPSKIDEPIFLVLPQTLEHIWDMIAPLESLVLGKASEGTPVLHVDLTHAFRAIPLAHLLIVLYLQERGLIHAGVCGYGAFQEGRNETPYLDLSYLLHLARWAQAVRSFRKRFDTAGLAVLLEHYEREARSKMAHLGFNPPPEVRRVINAARFAAPYFAAGLPLELGIKVRQTLGITTRENLEKAAKRLVPADPDLILELFDFLQPFAPAKVAKRHAKRLLVLDRNELAREVRLLHSLVSAGLPERACLVLREAIVNRLLLASCPQKWLQHSVRKAAEKVLNDECPCSEAPNASLSGALSELCSVWRDLRNVRNPLAHAGMQIDDVDVGQLTSDVNALIEKFHGLLDVDDLWQKLAEKLAIPEESSSEKRGEQRN